MLQLDRVHDFKLQVYSDLEQVLQLRPHYWGRDKRVKPNPFLLAFRAERDSIDPSRQLPGGATHYLPAVQLAMGQSPEGLRSKNIRTTLCGQVEYWIGQVAMRQGVTIQTFPVPERIVWEGWRVWTATQMGMEGRRQFGFPRVAGTVLGEKLFSPPPPMPVWVQVDQAEDLQGRQFGWRARIGWEGAGRSLPEPPFPFVRLDTPTVPTTLPQFHVLRVRTPQPLWVVCGGSPPLFHQGGETVWGAILYPEEIETLSRICGEWGGTVEVDPEGSDTIEPLSELDLV